MIVKIRRNTNNALLILRNDDKDDCEDTNSILKILFFCIFSLFIWNGQVDKNDFYKYHTAAKSILACFVNKLIN
jgi:hypothetical protein